MQGLAATPVRATFMQLIALVVVVSTKIAGVLPIIAMMLIPAAAAHHFSRTPKQMALFAALARVAAAFRGLAGSWHGDTPAGPSIMAAAACLFLLSPVFHGTT